MTDAIGRRREARERLDPWRAAALHAALDLPGAPPGAGDPPPPLGHWLYFLDAAPAGRLGRDGHPATGDFIPDLGLPRRMWAGSDLSFHGPLRLGAPARRLSEIEAVERKTGASGPLAFVTLRHEVDGPEGRAVTERQSLVYREDPRPDAPSPRPVEAPMDEDAARRFAPSPVILFRYSALTFNAHRIHYDRDYATGVEGYPGLVVHGPLIAQMLLKLGAERLARPVARFAFRARAPALDFEALEICAKAEGAAQALWARGPDGRLVMSGEAA